MKMPFLRPAILATATLAIAGCADYYGYPGYAAVRVGYASPYYASPYYGWYDDYYYPGVGVYIYGRTGERQRWNSAQRSYWQARRPRARVTENWSGYGRARPAQVPVRRGRR
ncbi:MAG: hypothetical protein J2O44_03840 [Porphyrobacter sp.]|nr:hypothetical protein [Porphyrobacter sp.]